MYSSFAERARRKRACVFAGVNGYAFFGYAVSNTVLAARRSASSLA